MGDLGRTAPVAHPVLLPPPCPCQITTCRGIVMGRLRSPQRNLEVSLMKFCLQKLGGWVGGWAGERVGGWVSGRVAIIGGLPAAAPR